MERWIEWIALLEKFGRSEVDYAPTTSGMHDATISSYVTKQEKE